MKSILLCAIGCGISLSAFAQTISLRHDLEGKALDVAGDPGSALQ
jgi:hypothetical protein